MFRTSHFGVRPLEHNIGKLSSCFRASISAVEEATPCGICGSRCIRETYRYFSELVEMHGLKKLGSSVARAFEKPFTLADVPGQTAPHLNPCLWLVINFQIRRISIGCAGDWIMQYVLGL